MAKYASAGGAQDEMYSDATGPGGSGGPENEPSKPDENEGQQTYLLPKAVLEGKDFEPGDEVVLRIVSMKGDQIEVTYAPAKEQEEEKGEQGQPEGEPAGGEAGGGQGQMASMFE